MNESKIDPCATPVWALYTCNDDAEIIHATLPNYPYKIVQYNSMWSEGGKWTGRSGWALTREELVEKNGIKESCSCCNKPFIVKTWCKPLPELLSERNLCFSCNHYLHTTIPNKDEPGHLSIQGQTYYYDVKKPIVNTDRPDFYGFGGRQFTIYLKNGEVVKTNNLWSGGVIPQRFLHLIPDNASFGEWPKSVGHGQGFLS